MDSTNTLQLLTNRLLDCVTTELKQFCAFSKWLRHEIEKQGVDPSSATAQEISEKDTGFDYASILAYIEGAMTCSQLPTYVGDAAHSQSPWGLDAKGGGLFGLYKRELRKKDMNTYTQKLLPSLGGLLHHLQTQSESLFERISETQRRNVQFGTPTYLGKGPTTLTDVRMIAEVRTCIGCTPRPLAVKGKAKQDRNGARSVSVYVALAMPMGKAFCIARLVKVDYRHNHQTGRTLLYREQSLHQRLEEGAVGGNHEQYELDLTDTDEIAVHTIHQFPAGKSWIPNSLEINGREGRRMVCIVTEDGLHYQQFDIDESEAVPRYEEVDGAMSVL
ncbi:MAG: hypothetical protein Q9219_004930 [cf. Caloplaca sp. 3 TL-2023]